MVEGEALGARVELDAARAGVEAARGPPRAASRGVEAAERGTGGRRGRGLGDDHVVGGRVAVRLVHREHERARVESLQRSTSSSRVQRYPSGSFAPMCVWTSNTSGPGHLGAHALEPGKKSGVVDHVGKSTYDFAAK